MIVLRSILFNIAFLFTSLVLGVVCLPVLLGTPAFMRHAGASWSAFVLRMLKLIVGTKYEVRGQDRIPDEPVIYAIKHQSAWDTLFFPAHLRSPAMVAKKELRLIPFYGWYIWRSGAVWLDRSKGARALRVLIRGTLKTLKEGRSIVMFPQGTRTLPGETRPYQPGIAALYAGTNAPIVPVVLNSGMYWGKRSFIKQPGTIIVEFLDPVPQGLDRDGFMNDLSQRIETATARLEAEARQELSKT